MYTPDYWCILDVGTCYKVFGSWAGSYLDGSSWRLNSGITKVEEDENYYYFYGTSNSIYKCRKEKYGCHWASAGQLDTFLSVEIVNLMPPDTDWMKLEFDINSSHGRMAI